LFEPQPTATTNSNYTGCTEESGFSTTADANNHFPVFGYDVSGNTQNNGLNAYIYDAESQIKTAAGVTHLYDGSGRRVSKSSGKLYWYGSGGEILAETSATGATLNEYIFFAGKRVAMLPAGGNPEYYAEDLLGSSRVTTTNNGTVCYDADFYPYGGERAYTNSCPVANVYKFEGKERDTETGNDDFGARYYSNRFGRWLSADWSAVPVAVPYANLTNPQTLNLYAMVADDPESFADLDGHDPTDPATVQTVVEVTMEEVDKIAGPLVESAKDSGPLGPALAVGVALGAATYVLIDSFTQRNNAEANLKMEEEKAHNDATRRKQQDQTQSPVPQDAVHKKRARPSTEQEHEEGQARKKRDRGGEKGDKRREDKGMFPRKRPPGYPKNGPWPPKPPKPPEPPKPPVPKPEEPKS
jgi:RHS repeat-associated protein